MEEKNQKKFRNKCQIGISEKKETDVAKILVRDMKKKSEEIKWKKRERLKDYREKCYIQNTDQRDAQYRKLVFLGKRKDEMELKAFSKI